jgi:hypothetical protein
MRQRPEWDDDRTRLDLNPADEPVAGEPVGQPLMRDEVVDPRMRRMRVVRTVCGVINLVCGVFAVVLAVHIVLVLAEANPRNGFASFVDSWSAAVSLGLRGLFDPASQKLQVLFNDGLAAIAWLLIAWALTYAIRQFALPGPGHPVRYRRHVVE